MRSSFDKILLDATCERGAQYMDCEAVAPIQKNGRITGLQIQTASGALENLLCDILGRLLWTGNLSRQPGNHRSKGQRKL